MLSQFMILFGFFALILVAIFWINKAVRMFDHLISDGQSAWVFLEFTALTLPAVIAVVLPIAAFAAAVYVTNRLSTENELTVMQATGYSHWRMARPAVIFGLIVALMMSILTHVLVPASAEKLRLREAEVARNLTAKLLTVGEFLHPASGVTFYIRSVTPEGELQNVFLSDRRDPENPIVYTSPRAYLVPEDGGTKLVMVSGLAQYLRGDGDRLFTTHYDDFSYDISSLIPEGVANLDKVEFISTAALLAGPALVAERTGATLGQVVFETHSRISEAVICVAAALIGFAALLLGTFSRFGVWWQIVTAFLLLVAIKLGEGMVSGPVLANPSLWPLMYLPGLLGLATVAVLLFFGSRALALRRILVLGRSARGDPA